MFGGTPTSGSVLRWFRDKFAHEEQKKASEEGRDVYDLLIDEASKAEIGSLNLFFYPYFEGSGTPAVNRDARGAIIGLTLAHNKGDILRAILESLAFELRRNIETFRNYGFKINEIRVTGGGAKSPFWVQLKADVTKIDVLVPEAKMETTALGAAILTTREAQIYKTFNEAALHMSRLPEKYEPESDKGKLYDEIYGRYLKLQKRLLKFYA
jgi:xylulokinase